MTDAPQHTQDDRELVLTRIIESTPDKLFRCWTEPELLKQWFAPKPYQTVESRMDLRPGGESYLVMRSPEGQEMPNPGVILEVIPNAKLVFTDAYTAGWKPAVKPFFTAILTFEDLGDGTTRYTARARHWTKEDCETHAKMGFHQGWGICADQLADLAKTL